MKKIDLTLLIGIVCALNTWSADCFTNATITTKIVNPNASTVTYYCKYDKSGTITSQPVTINSVSSNLGRIMVAIMDACFEGDGKLQYADSTQTNAWKWYTSDKSFIKVTGIVIPAHSLTNAGTPQWIEPKFRFCADGYFDQANKYADSWAALRPHPTWASELLLLTGTPEKAYLDSGWQYFNAFFKYASFSCNSCAGPDGQNLAFFKGEGFTFCFDADIKLGGPKNETGHTTDLDNPRTATMAEACARVMARKTCCTYMNQTIRKIYPSNPNNAYLVSYNYLPSYGDIGSINSNWHTWDGDFTYGGYDIYYNTYSAYMTRYQTVLNYD